MHNVQIMVFVVNIVLILHLKIVLLKKEMYVMMVDLLDPILIDLRQLIV